MENSIPVFEGWPALKKKKATCSRGEFSDSWQTAWDSLTVCVCWVRWVKQDQRAVWFHWQRETHFTSVLLQSLHSLLLPKQPTHMRAMTVAKYWLCCAGLFGCCAERQTGWTPLVSIHQTRANQPSPAGRCSISVLVWSPSESASSGSDPAPGPPCHHRQMS